MGMACCIDIPHVVRPWAYHRLTCSESLEQVTTRTTFNMPACDVPRSCRGYLSAMKPLTLVNQSMYSFQLLSAVKVMRYAPSSAVMKRSSR
jgi:hypothetical protein